MRIRRRLALCAAIISVVSLDCAWGGPISRDVSERLPTTDDLRGYGVPLPDPLPIIEQPQCSSTTTGGTPCPQGTYWIHGRRIVDDPRLDLQNDAIVIEGDQISTLSGCRPTRAAIRPTEEGYSVTATWPECGDRRDVRIKATVDRDTLATLVGKVIFSISEDVGLVATIVHHEAIRIGTYNTKFITSGPPASYQKNPEDAAKKIAARIKASRYDFIALQEVWDEDAKENDDSALPGFVQELSATYPYYAQYLDGDQLNPHEDSGLMFFSRFPFEDLPHDTYQIDSGDCEASDCDKVAFYEYDSCDDDDCLAEKGAGFVRLRNPKTNRIYNVAFTHLQAPYYDDPPDEMLATYETRAEQFGEIETLLEATLDDQSFQTEDIYVMGDLNIDGDLANPDKGEPDANDPAAGMFVHNSYEWARQFATPGSFFTDNLTDMWAYDTSPDDRGLSAPRNYEPHYEPAHGRLDFIARNVNSRMCTQHVTLAHNLRWGAPYVESGLGQPGTEAGAMELSDHIGVTADINLHAPYCSAAAPRAMTIAPGALETPKGEIVHPGGMQWFRFEDPGTYGFAVEGGDVAFHVYESTDLSMPMANYKGLTRMAFDDRGNLHELKMFVVPKAPFYVRVFVPNYSGWTGGYTLVVKLYDCSTKDESCLLGPQQTRTETFPGGTFVGDEDAMWFELHTEASGWDKPGGVHVDTGLAQSLEFEVDRLDVALYGLLSMQVRSGDGAAVLDEDAVDKADFAEPDYSENPTNRLIVSLEEPGPETRYIRVKRADPDVEASFRVQWRTNLTVLHGSQVGVPNAVPFDFSVADHGDEIGDEEYYFWLITDGQTVVDEAHLGDHSEPSNVSLEHLVTAVRYVGSVQAIWVEVDNAYDGGYDQIDDDDLLETDIGALAPDAPCVVGEHTFMSDDEEYGSYYFSYNLCHGLPIP